MTEAAGNVTALPGVSLRTRETDQAVIDNLERLLADARAGVVVAVAYTALTGDGLIKYHWVGDGVTGNAMGGAISLLGAAFGIERVRVFENER